MDITLLSPSALKPSPRNPRITPDSAIDTVAESIKRFGFRQPIVVDEDNFIIIGHVRHQASLRLDLPEVPVHVAIGLSEAEVDALRLVDNRTAELTDWDEALLNQELAVLAARSDGNDMTGIASRPLEGFENLFAPEIQRHRQEALRISFGFISAPWGEGEKAWYETMSRNYGDGLKDEIMRRLQGDNRTGTDGVTASLPEQPESN